LALGGSHPVRSRPDRLHLEARLLQVEHDQPAQVGLVVDEEDAITHGASVYQPRWGAIAGRGEVRGASRPLAKAHAMSSWVMGARSTLARRDAPGSTADTSYFKE